MSLFFSMTRGNDLFYLVPLEGNDLFDLVPPDSLSLASYGIHGSSRYSEPAPWHLA